MVHTPTGLEQNCGHPSLSPGRRQKEPGASPSFDPQGVRTNNMNVFRMTVLPRGEEHACGMSYAAAVESSLNPICFCAFPRNPPALSWRWPLVWEVDTWQYPLPVPCVCAKMQRQA